MLPREAVAATGESTWTENERVLGGEEFATLRRQMPALTTAFSTASASGSAPKASGWCPWARRM